MISPLIACLALLGQVPAPETPAVGPPRGSLVVVGGGQIGREIVARFLALSGGPDAEVVLIPTAGADPIDPKAAGARFSEQFGLGRVTVLHTRDREEADSEEFVAPLKKARAVWFEGGRQWRIADSYLNTRTQREIEAVLGRGGVIGGSSAGATIQGSYLLRGAISGPDILMAKGHEQGFAYLRGVAIDQHLLPRNRVGDLVQVVGAHPELLGLGIDESTAIVVDGDRFEVIGRGVVGIYDGRDHDGLHYYFLAPGERFDLKSRSRVQVGRLPDPPARR